jgi:hypothetical protein
MAEIQLDMGTRIEVNSPDQHGPQLVLYTPYRYQWQALYEILCRERNPWRLYATEGLKVYFNLTFLVVIPAAGKSLVAIMWAIEPVPEPAQPNEFVGVKSCGVQGTLLALNTPEKQHKINATLIIVPKVILNQWQSYLERAFSSNGPYRVLSKGLQNWLDIKNDIVKIVLVAADIVRSIPETFVWNRVVVDEPDVVFKLKNEVITPRAKHYLMLMADLTAVNDIKDKKNPPKVLNFVYALIKGLSVLPGTPVVSCCFALRSVLYQLAKSTDSLPLHTERRDGEHRVVLCDQLPPSACSSCRHRRDPARGPNRQGARPGSLRQRQRQLLYLQRHLPG